MRRVVLLACLLPALVWGQGVNRTPNLRLPFTNTEKVNEGLSRIDEVLGPITGGVYDQANRGKVFDAGGGEVNVKAPNLGALGDGSTNDTTALQKAFTHACSTTKRVRIPSGTYILRSPGLTVGCSGLTVTCDGATLYWDTLVGGAAVVDMILVSGYDDFTIEGCTFQQTNTTATFSSAYEQNNPLGFKNADRARIRRNKFLDIWGNSAINLRPSTTTGSDSSDDAVIEGNYFARCAVYGVAVISGKRNLVVDNDAEDCALGTETNNTNNVAAENAFDRNRLRSVVKTADTTYPTMLTTGSRDSDDVGNTITNNTLDGGYILASGAQRVRIEGNTVRNWTSTDANRSPIFLTNVQNARISRNTIDGTTFAAAITNGRGLLSLVGVTDAEVVGNIITGSATGHGLGCRDCTRVAIRGGLIRDNLGSGIQFYLTNTDVTVDGVSIIDNNTSNNGFRAGVHFSGHATDGSTTRGVVQNSTIISPASDKQAAPFRLDVANVTLTNNVLTPRQASNAITTSGTVTLNTTSELAAAPTAQTIAAGNTVSADACGGIKRISSAGSVTTDTTNTFTAPGVTNQGCIMLVCNTSANAITLDQNALFTTASGSDVVLTDADDCVEVASDGAKWRQTSAVLAGS